MLKLPILLSGLLMTPVSETVWWNTNGGHVIERRDPTAATCTLTIENGEGQFAFVWEPDLPTRITVRRNGWSFPPDQITNASMRIGDVWLSDGNGTPNIAAITGTSTVKFVVNESVASLLSSAGVIIVRTPDAQFGIELIPGKMKALLTALNKCRTAISR